MGNKDSPFISVFSETDTGNVKPFYEGAVHYRPANKCLKSILKNPRALYEYLCSKVYLQDNYAKDASMIMYSHLRGIPSVNFVVGPPGCGKTYLWQCLSKLYNNIIIVDASDLTKDGWSGGHKVTDFITEVNPLEPNAIVVFDEADKMFAPLYSHESNTSYSLQSEFLKLIEGKILRRKIDNSTITVDTSRMSFIFCGSFALQAEKIANNSSSSGIGFGSQRTVEKAYTKELTFDDLKEYGVIPELLSRATRLINLHPLTLDDYIFLLTRFGNSPLKQIESLYHQKLNINAEQLTEIAKQAFDSGLGIRQCGKKLQTLMDEQIFNSFSQPFGNAEEFTKEGNEDIPFITL